MFFRQKTAFLGYSAIEDISYPFSLLSFSLFYLAMFALDCTGHPKDFLSYSLFPWFIKIKIEI